MSRALALFLVVTAASFLGSAPPPEPALSRTAGDPDLSWGPCPPLFPQGCEIAVLHGNPAEANADVFLRVPGGYDIPLHWHTSAERMILISGELRVTYTGQAPVVLKSGSYAYGPAKAPHEAHCAAGSPCVLFIAFEQPVDAVAGSPPLAGSERGRSRGWER